MKLVLISDTHGFHNDMTVPEGDILIHAGDCTGRGLYSQVADFLDWFAARPHKHKIMVAGNHDFYFEDTPAAEIARIIPAGVTYLDDSEVVVEGLRIWGSPITTYFYNWAFNRHPGPEIKKHWDLIPANTDILITHGPPRGIMDRTHSGIHVGCVDLLEAVGRIRPKVHVFGHIHEGYGRMDADGVEYINAASLSADYRHLNPAVVVEL